ncbi:chemotaxis protein CheD [Patescibacteria group bacterium]|nr:chemotaxis protein CheD [Patescibacteria group bacterium]
MSNTVKIGIGELAVGKGRECIKTSGVGSCVVIALYDPDVKVGGLAHAMLPTNKISGDKETKNKSVHLEKTAKYVDEAIRELILTVEKKGGKRERLSAKLVGGAQMTPLFGGLKESIGVENVREARKQLKAYAIPLVNEDTGGSIGKLIEFYSDSGLLKITSMI